jgi:hypothetical protein
MLKQLQRWLLQLLGRLFSDAWANALARLFTRRSVDRIRVEATEDILDILLHAMEVCFYLDRSYRNDNLTGFSGVYVFTATERPIGGTARFANGYMHASRKAEKEFTIRVRFKSADALRRFLFKSSPDVLDALLDDEVELDGNLNYIYKFGFMVTDLERRLGLLD